MRAVVVTLGAAAGLVVSGSAFAGWECFWAESTGNSSGQVPCSSNPFDGNSVSSNSFTGNFNGTGYANMYSVTGNGTWYLDIVTQCSNGSQYQTGWNQNPTVLIQYCPTHIAATKGTFYEYLP
jgi:hypothetical protein